MTRLLIIDDSALMRRLLIEIFTSAGDFEVAVARSGAEALEMLADVAPDVITLDVNMPGMDGLVCLDRIMVIRPCPIVMVSSLTADGAEETLEAMALGAVDFIAKPKGAVSLEIDAIADDLVDKVRAASKARISRTTRLQERVRARARGGLAGRKPRPVRSIPDGAAPLPRLSRVDGETGLVLVGCSTGGPPALDAVLGELSEDFPWPILIAQHMPASFTGPLARRLDRMCALTVREITGTTPLLPGHAYIGKGDADLILSRRNGHLVALPAPSSSDYFWHPSVDRLVDSAMRLVAPDRLVGVLMTGMGTDGAAAMTRLKQAGGLTIAEAESSAVVWGMPGALVQADGAGIVRPLGRIADALTALLPA
ncbi:chemotaxis-specific protein-glutamate methyltransferase CheB (plasmid) [Novosphingobium resinovorum]|uniref:chemotaxis-specific protein-glutamate methyltransferase CheB n=1 Tax=Novosphingobium TaxID=165696 RepID=UPI001B3CA397|nr:MULTISPECIES: chemotaxis-specific protein-glutamate methyltransferase CheB [Novosphingobium]MBF7015558.1 chemotaxis-specific protein-glutamate methyltransferase CheB [Novosphingobium sp. HR1a]WJM30234.1 chemotaxis-specific protein-glutamate methyltransferase CheB [Novosphingobium resinovorum]